MKNRNLVVSINTYLWVRHMAGSILKSDDSFDVIILNKDYFRPMLSCKKLCYNAVNAQRRHDTYRLGKALKVNKIMNFGYNKLTDDQERLLMQLTLHITLSNIKTVYYESNNFLDNVFSVMLSNGKIDEAYKYNIANNVANCNIELSNDVFKQKKALRYLMVGANNTYELNLNNKIERFYKV